MISEKAAPRIPKELSDVDVAGMLCGGITAYGAVRKLVTEARVPPGKAYSHHRCRGRAGALRCADSQGLWLHSSGCGCGPERVEFVRKLGADYAVDAPDAERFIKDKLGASTLPSYSLPGLLGIILG